jgi:dimethylargininase
MRFTQAIVRPPADNLVDGLTLAHLGRVDPDLAREQHAAYRLALTRLGLAVTCLPADSLHPDSTFVEDTAILTPRGAIVTRPGAPSRQGEVAAMRHVLRGVFPDLAEITAPGTVDGGDICECPLADGTIHYLIGVGDRTNAAGAAQLGAWLAGIGYTAATVDITVVPGLLHLKTGLSYLGDGRLALIAELAEHPELAGFEKLLVDAAEAYAANCVRVHDTVLLPTGCPRLTARIQNLGLATVSLDMSEFRKVDGGLSCLSLRW